LKVITRSSKHGRELDDEEEKEEDDEALEHPGLPLDEDV